MFDALKHYPRETYGDTIQRLIEDETELAEKTKREIKQALKEIKQGGYLTHEQLKKELRV